MGQNLKKARFTNKYPALSQPGAGRTWAWAQAQCCHGQVPTWLASCTYAYILSGYKELFKWPQRETPNRVFFVNPLEIMKKKSWWKVSIGRGIIVKESSRREASGRHLEGIWKASRRHLGSSMRLQTTNFILLLAKMQTLHLNVHRMLTLNYIDITGSLGD